MRTWILAASLISSSSFAASNAQDYQDALHVSFQALIKLPSVKQRTKILQRQYIPPELIRTHAWWINISRALIEKRVQFKWSFP